MKRTIFFFLFVWACNLSATNYEPYVYRQNFESGEPAAWSSYPLTQDNAYDPFLYPGKISDSDLGTSLCKVYYPSWNVPQLVGVSKKLAMRLDNESRINFRYYVKTTNAPSWLGIDFGLTDGDRIRACDTSIKTNQWVSVSLSLSDLLKLAERQQIENIDITAIALTVRFEKSDPDMPIYFAIDDVEITGKKAVAFKYTIPETRKLEEWEPEIALKHYEYGEGLGISGSFLPSKPGKVILGISRFDNPGKEIFNCGLISSGNLWKTEDEIELDSNRFPAGMYITTLKGISDEKIVARSSFTFFVVDKERFSNHPRLWFDKKGMNDFTARIKTKKFQSVLIDIRKRAADAKINFPNPDIPYDLDLFPAETDWLPSLGVYGSKIGGIAHGALSNALLSIIDNDPDAATYAKAMLMSMCKWKSWQHPWILNMGQHTYYSVGYTGRDLALTFDILYDSFTPAERKFVANSFIKNNVIPAFKGYVVNNLVTTNGSNWIPRITSGALMGMFSIMDEYDDTSELEPYLSGILYKHKAVLDDAFGDGGYGEGFGYYGGTVAAFCRSMPAMERILGMDMSKILDKSYKEIFWSSDPDNENYFTFGDAGIHSGPTAEMINFPWLMKKYRDPNLAWMYEIYYKTYYGKNRCSIDEVLYDIGDIPAERPTGLKGAKWFKDVGTVVFRSGDEPNPFIFSFRCGPFANHQHLDQGTFFLADHGEIILTEQGYGSYYTDPLYQSHIIQPVSHNTILIDHNPQSQRTGDPFKYAAGFYDYARVTDFVKGEDFAFAMGDLTPVYLGNVKELKRGILYIQPRTILIIDQFKAEKGEASMDVLFHTTKFNNTSVVDNTFKTKINNGEFTGTVISPLNAGISLKPDPIKLSKFTKETLEPLGRVTVTTKTIDGNAMSVVLLAEESVDNSNTTDESVFLSLKDADILINKKGGIVSGGNISSDGLLAAFSINENVICVDGTFCSLNGRKIFTSDNPVTLIIGKGNVSFSNGKNSVINFYNMNKICSLVVNEKELTEWKVDASSGFISIKLPPGQGTMIFK